VITAENHFQLAENEKSYLKTWSLGLRMGARGTVSAQTNVTSVVGDGGVCIVPNHLSGAASRTNLCALSPDEVKAIREFFLLLNEWNDAEGRHGY
jgi:hypothetical protein